MHLKAISGAYGNWIGSIPLNPFQSGTPKVHTSLKLKKNPWHTFVVVSQSGYVKVKHVYCFCF